MADGWWNNNGVITGCVAAYQPVGAASLAASYSNLFNPGTNDAAPGTAPTWNATDGWIFNGTTQYLNGPTPVLSAQDWWFLIRYNGMTQIGAAQLICGCYRDGTGSRALALALNGSDAGSGASTPNVMRAYDGNTNAFALNGPVLISGVYGVGGLTAYRNGSAEGNAIPTNAPTGAAVGPFVIGALGYNGSSQIAFAALKAQAFVIGNGAITAGEIATITTAMQALPVASGGKGLPALAHWHEAVMDR